MEKTAKDELGVYYGLDISDKYAMISYLQLNMEAPATISTVAGSEVFLIPLYIAKRRGMAQWFFGDEARRQVGLGLAVGVDRLYERALAREKVILETEEFLAVDLFVIYLRKLLSMPVPLMRGSFLKKLIITVDDLTMEAKELFALLINKLSISPEKLGLFDYRECFYYYVLNQTPSLFLHDVMLYHYDGNHVKSFKLRRDQSFKPQIVHLDMRDIGPLLDNLDEAFCSVVTKDMDGEYISSVYLTGDGFDGDWLKKSLAVLCRDRRVFLGKNLFSKGACYAGMIRDGQKDWPFLFIGDHELKVNVSLKVLDRNEMRFITLLSAGDNWFDVKGECEVILDGTREVELWIQRPDSRQATVELLELNDLPERKNRTTRLRIQVQPVSDRDLKITIRDLGFGELVLSSGKVWEHDIHVALEDGIWAN